MRKLFLLIAVALGTLAMGAWPQRGCGQDKADDARKQPARATFKLEIPTDDRALWTDMKDGRFTGWSFAEAALLASGVADSSKRKSYLERLAELEQQARKELAAAQPLFDKGEKLLLWLHGKSRPLKKYVKNQTDLSVLLDTGNYNCVSSALLYNVLGRRLGLDLRAIEVSDHAFSILYDGKDHADVETTTGRGFNPSRDKKALDEFKEQTGFVYIPERHKNERRETGEAGLVAAVYFNHGVLSFRQKKYREALIASVCAMNLDPDAFAVKEAHASLARWTGELARLGQLDEALQILDQAADLLKNPAVMTKMTHALYDTVARDLSRQKDWKGAVEVYTKALQREPNDKHFQDNARAAWDAWARTFMKTKDWSEAIKIYRKGLERFPDSKVFANNIKYCEQQMKK